ncbi:MAG: LysM peptidoglycan-binding domain-containing protein [Lentimonas sp.]
MKVSKIFGFVLCLHLGIITVLIVQPGCRTTQPPTQTYKYADVSSVRSNVEGATSTSDGLIEATRLDEGSTLDAAFNAGIEGDNYGSTPEFAEFDNVTPIDPIISQGDSSNEAGPSVDISGPSFETYTVKKGDSLWAISKRQNVSLSELYVANGLNKNSVLSIGQQIQIPAEGSSATVSTLTADAYQPTSFNTGSESYTVKRGDTLSKIASQYGTTVGAIKASNGKTSDMIRVGEKLVIPVLGSSSSDPRSSFVAPVLTTSATTVAPAAIVSGRTHTVKSGDYPATIARKYGMTSGDLLALNGITDPRKLQIGQVLQVSASGSSANVATSTETFTAPAPTTTSIPATFAPAPTQAQVAANGPVEIRVIEADPLVDVEADIIDVDSQFEGVVEIPVIRLEE